MYCIIEAMLARSSDVVLRKPQLVNVPQFLLGDSDRLRGILLNLYTNAAKFTRRGAISMRVSVHGPNYRPEPEQHAALYTSKQVCGGLTLQSTMYRVLLRAPPALKRHVEYWLGARLLVAKLPRGSGINVTLAHTRVGLQSNAETLPA